MAGGDKSVLDTKLFGFYLREARTKAGYEKAEDFAYALEERIGYSVSKQTIYNIESGKQEPRLSLYLAMMRLLRPDRPPVADEMVTRSLPARWQVPLAVSDELDQMEISQEDDGSSSSNLPFAPASELIATTIGSVMTKQLAEMTDAISISPNPAIKTLADAGFPLRHTFDNPAIKEALEQFKPPLHEATRPLLNEEEER